MAKKRTPMAGAAAVAEATGSERVLLPSTLRAQRRQGAAKWGTALDVRRDHA
jgi:hypothetical protein